MTIKDKAKTGTILSAQVHYRLTVILYNQLHMIICKMSIVW